MRSALQGERSDIWTAMPGIVQSFNPDEQTCEVQLSVRFRIGFPALNTYTSPTKTLDPSGQYAWDNMPLLLDCPVVFPGGGGVTLTFPIKAGDEVLVVFASRCIDGWWQQGGIQNQAAVRMHDLSDGFVIPQVRSQPRAFAVSTSAVELRTDDGATKVSLDPTTKAVAVTTEGDCTITASTIYLQGNVVTNGTITNNGKDIGSGHIHSASGGPGNGGPPV